MNRSSIFWSIHSQCDIIEKLATTSFLALWILDFPLLACHTKEKLFEAKLTIRLDSFANVWKYNQKIILPSCILFHKQFLLLQSRFSRLYKRKKAAKKIAVKFQGNF